VDEEQRPFRAGKKFSRLGGGKEEMRGNIGPEGVSRHESVYLRVEIFPKRGVTNRGPEGGVSRGKENFTSQKGGSDLNADFLTEKKGEQ